jgi:hypothetical protein
MSKIGVKLLLFPFFLRKIKNDLKVTVKFQCRIKRFSAFATVSDISGVNKCT